MSKNAKKNILKKNMCVFCPYFKMLYLKDENHERKINKN